MRVHYSKIVRRGLIGVIFIVILLVLYNFSRNFRIAKPPKHADVLPPDTISSGQSIIYKENKNGITQFTVGAQRVIETRDGKDFLQGIEAYDFNPDRSVRNKICSQRAVYDKARKIIDFSGDVRLSLGKDAEMRTESLHYDLNTDVGTTSDLLQLYSPGISGKARGIRFEQGTQSLELASEVEFDLNQAEADPDKARTIGSMHASSERAYSSGTTNKIVFQGKARIESKEQGNISGDGIEAFLSSDQRHVTSLISTGNAVYRSKEGRILSGNRMTFGIGESRSLEKISIAGEAVFVSNSSAEEESLSGGEMDLDFDPDKGALTRIQARRRVQFRMKRGLEQTLITGEQFDAAFDPEKKNLTNVHVINSAKLSSEGSKDSASNDLQADDLRLSFRQMNGRAAINKINAEGSVRWRSMPPKTSTAQVREAARSLEASKLELENSAEGDYLDSGKAVGKVVISEAASDRPVQQQMRRLSADSARFQFFPKDNQLKELIAEGHVQTTFEKKNKGAGGATAINSFRTASDRLKANFALIDGRSAVQSAVQWGNFSYRDDATTATAGRCDYEAGKELMLLTESPRISDASSSTSGDRVEYDRNRKILSVRGNVQSKVNASNSAQKGTPNAAPKSDNFFFSTSPKASSSQSIIMADGMQYETETGHFRYSGNVRSLSETQQLHARVLDIYNGGDRVEAQGDIWHLVNEASQARKSQNNPNSRKSPITIRSERMRYSRASNELNYSENVNLSYVDMKMSSTNLEAKIDKDGMIESVTASEKVQITHQGGRECKGDTAHWAVDTEKFTVKGKPAIIYDPVRGRSEARQLTYFKGNDSILLGKP